jgi:hypothetical protein
MTEQTQTLDSLASEGYRWFEQATRPNGGESYTRLKDGHPDWLKELVYAAHGNGEFLPDDWRYEVIQDALERLSDAEGEDLDDLAHEFADDVDVYTGELNAWLSSDLRRQGYCDAAAEDGLVAADASLVQRIMAGQYTERLEVFAAVREALEEEVQS